MSSKHGKITQSRPSSAGQGQPATGVEQVNLLLSSGKPEQALDLVRELLKNTPDDTSLLLFAGKVHQQQGNTGEALSCLKKLTNLAPEHYEANIFLAKIYHNANCKELALHHIKLAEQVDPNHQFTLEQKGLILAGFHHYDEAINTFEQIIKQGSPSYVTWNNLGNQYRNLGLFDEAQRCYLTAMEISGQDDMPYNNYLTLTHYLPEFSKEKILQLYQDWERRYAADLKKAKLNSNEKNVNKKIRLGMVSDGFRTHPVGQMITSALESIPAYEIEIYAYSTNLAEDKITDRIKNISAKWMTITHLSPEKLAQQLADDNIDVLFDLCGHNTGSRMRTMAMKPAPILVKWVGGLINTTGLSTIDYLLSDAVETQEEDDKFYTEKLIRMPDDYICYNPPIYTPNIHAPPARYNGYITLGCFNNPTKLNPVLLEQWARIMRSLPNSRLFLKGFQFSSETLTNNIKVLLLEQGITEDRVTIEGPSRHEDLLKAYNKVDIALDPWPYSGGLTTCEAIYMGVPVVTLPGPTFAGRHSATHLVNAGMPQLVAQDWDQYHDIVLALASDLDNLANIRAHLRGALLASPVCDAQRFARNFSNAMRAIWQRYCEGKEPAALSLDKEGNAYFADETEAVQLQLPPEPMVIEDDDFHFRFNGKIVTLDNGAGLCSSPAFAGLHKLGALTTICLDPGSRLTNAQQLQHTGDFHYVPMTVLGDGEPVTLYATLEPAYSSTLKVHSSSQQPEELGLQCEVIAELPINSIRLDDIEGIDTLEWLVLDNMHDIHAILEHGSHALAQALLVQIRVNFIESHNGQPELNTCRQLMRPYGYRFHQLVNKYKQANSQESVSDKELLFADAVFLPDTARLEQLTDNQRLKLAFLLHTAYGSYALVHELLAGIDHQLTENYLNSLSPADKQQAGLLSTLPGQLTKSIETQGHHFDENSSPLDMTGINILKAGRYTHTSNRVCVGVPIYNEAAYITETLSSLKRQSLDDAHFLIIDNASTDQSVELCLDLIGDDERFTLLRQHENRGAMHNFQAAFDLSRSTYFMWLGGHDYLSDNYLADAVAVLEQSPQVAMVLGQPHAVLNGQHHGLVKEALYDFSAPNPLERYLASIARLGNCTIVHSLFRRQALQAHRLRQTISADHVLISHLLWHGQLHYLDDARYYRRFFEQRDTTQSERISGNKNYLSRYDFYRFYLDDFARLYQGDSRIQHYLEGKILSALEGRFGVQGLLEHDGLHLY
ncbi:O-linked N-acetylglucosamine transferase family protein [Zobellella denitrificans]